MSKHIDFHKLFVAITLTLSTAAVFLSLGYAVGRESVNEEQTLSVNTPASKASASKTAGATATATADATMDWKTYTNSELSYSIKYPTDWIIDTNFIKDNSIYLLTKERKQNLDADKIVRVFDVSVRFFQSVSDLPNNQTNRLSFENWIKQEADNYGFIQRKTILVDGASGYQGIGSGDGESYLIFVQKGDSVYQIETGDSTTPTVTEQRIIDSFKFL